MNALKKEFLELLDKDVEFRYTVAGYLGLSEILKRLDALAEEQVKLRKEQIKLREEQVKLRKEQIKLRKEQIKLREDLNKIFSALDTRLNRVERTLEKLTVDVEDEARSIIKYRVKEELGVDVEINSLTLPDLEFNIYGVSDNICIIGEATVRGGVNIIDELLEKIEIAKRKYPDKIREKVVPVVYVCLPLPELVERAKSRNIWVLKATQDFYKPLFR
ncbi:MAG: hypothetical protein QXY40_10440 [Candidatus Methanomethylicia archaeon]